MLDNKKLASTVACIMFFAIMGAIAFALAYATISEWRNICREQHACADWLDCDNWGWDCIDIA